MTNTKNTGRTRPDSYRERRNENAVDTSTMIYGKVPPQARELEEAVLGIIMQPWEKEAFDTSSETLTPEMFYVDAHQMIFRAMKSLSGKSKPINMLTVVEELRFAGELDRVGGPYYVTKLTNNVTLGTTVDYYSKIIYQKYLQREMISICMETVSQAYEDATDVFDMMEAHEKALTEITATGSGTDMVEIETGLVEMMQEIEARRLSDTHLTGVPSGFTQLDEITHGWQKTDLIILAARPSVGKTAFACNLAMNAALHPESKTCVAFFSLEMSRGQLIERITAAQTETPLEAIKRGTVDDRDMERIYRKGVQPLAGTNLFIDDTPALTLSQLRKKARKLKRKVGVDLLLIDYLQLMQGEGGKSGNREQEISNISRSLKSLAKELQVPIIALSQLSREVEKRKADDQMPKLSDLRESGAIEQDADMVCFIYRPEYHGNNSNEMGESTSGETHLRIAKHRNGTLANLKFTAKLDIQKFVPFEGHFHAPTELPAGGWKPVGTRASADDDLF